MENENKEQNSVSDELFSRGVGEFIDPDNIFRKKLEAKMRGEYQGEIVIKFGIDPTRPDIHLGHAVIFRKLRKFQDLGCKVVFLVGDYTASIGDPTGKSKVRPELEQQEINTNMISFLEQIDKILTVEKTKLPTGEVVIQNTPIFSWIRNSDWYTVVNDLKLPDTYEVSFQGNMDGMPVKVPVNANSLVGKAIVFEDSRMQTKSLGLKHVTVTTLRTFLWGLKHITHARLIERDMFQERIKNSEELYMHEMIYPVLQGIDSHAIGKIYGSCDLEVGGTDQTFNMLVGRDVMKASGQEPQAVISFKLLVGLDGKEKMSKSLDNYVSVTDTPEDMYGKLMSIPDTALRDYFDLCTFTPLDTIQEIMGNLEQGKENPKEVKMRMAKEVVSIYHGEEKAVTAQKAFTETFSEGKIPDVIETVSVSSGTSLVDILVNSKVVSSKTDFRRLITEGAIKNMETDEKITDVAQSIESGMTVKVGKRRFLKIEIEK